ncbi:unnamed protein product [Caenorhabditis brenneri]
MRVHHGAQISCNENRPVNYIILPTWKSCIKKCADTEDCAVAHTISGNPSKCYTCSISKLGTIRKTSDQKNQIALKTDATNKHDCDSFENGTFFGTFNSFNNLTQYQYTTTKTKSGWSFEYNIKKFCPPNWQKFKRSRGEWCIQVSSGSYNQSAAIAKCQESGATLTALETNEEKMYIWENASRLISDNLSQIWIDGQRREKCHVTGTPKAFPPGCEWIKGFDFMDKVFNNDNYKYVWEQSNPDCLYDSKTQTYQDCLAMWIRPNDGLIDDVFCADPPYMFGYACGKLAG